MRFIPFDLRFGSDGLFWITLLNIQWYYDFDRSFFMLERNDGEWRLQLLYLPMIIW